MSRRIDSLRQIVQDLESPYGKDDAGVQVLHADLGVLIAIKNSDWAWRRKALGDTVEVQRRSRPVNHELKRI